jgi:DNA-directed RNA polymerase specialized sigma24 family protein
MDLTLERVAEVLEIPQGTAYSRFSRAMDAMRAALEADARQMAAPSARQGATR